MEHDAGRGKRRPRVPVDGGGARTASSREPTRIGPWKALRAAKSVRTGRLRAISIQLCAGGRWAQHASIAHPVRRFGAWFHASHPLRPGVPRVELWLLGSTHLLGQIEPLLLLRSSCHHHLERTLAVRANGVWQAIVGFSPYCSLSRGMRSDHS